LGISHAIDLNNIEIITSELRMADRKCIATDSYDENCIIDQFTDSLHLDLTVCLSAVEV
jgi:hypothetical protein